VDSVNRVYRVQRELSESANAGPYGQAAIGGDRMEVQARKFYSQRNMYVIPLAYFGSVVLITFTVLGTCAALLSSFP
jgi:hypothetical protein